MSQHRDLLGRSGVGLGALVDAGQPQVGDDQLIGHAVVGDHVIGLDISHGDGLAVLLDGVVGRAAGELVEHGLGGGAGDHHRVSGGAGGAIVQAHHLAVRGVQGHLAAGAQLQIQLLIGGHRVFLGRGIGRGVAVDVVPGAVGACEIGGLGGAGQGHGDGGGLVGEEGDDAVFVVQHQHAPASLKGGGHHTLLRREIGPIRGADGALGIVVLRGGVGVQQDDFLLHRGAQGLVVGAAGGRLAPQGVDKELGGLGPGDGGAVRKGDPVGEPQGVGQVQIALRPDGSGVGLIVGEQPDQDGHRLREGDLLVGGEGAVPPPGDQPGLGLSPLSALRGGAGAGTRPSHRDGGGQVDVAPGPV